jgi:glycosyltransferase involved in cell wall biosynthesis
VGVPVVSVVIPAYNSARFIGETIEHVLAQDLPDVEVIVVNDGSTDDTLGVVARYPSVKVVDQTNAGVAAARNAGVRAAQGEWVGFVDSDDLWHPQMLSSCLALARLHPWTMMVLSNSVQQIDHVALAQRHDWPQGIPPHRLEESFEAVFRHPYLGMSSVFMRRQVFLDVGGFNESLRRAEDIDLYLRLLHGRRGYVRLMFDAVHVRVVEGSLSSDSVAGYEQILGVYAAFLHRHPTYATDHPRLLADTFADIRLRHARALLRSDRQGQAILEAWRAVRLRFNQETLALLLRALVPLAWTRGLRRAVGRLA